MKRPLSHAPVLLASLAALGALTVSPWAVAGGGGAAVVVKGPWMQHVTATSAIVRIEVTPPSPVTLELALSRPSGAVDSGLSGVIESRETRALHSILVQNLEPATRYAITARARGAQKDGALTTAPRDDAGAPFRFVIYGDNRSDDVAHAAVVRAIAEVPSDFLVHTGDFVESGASAAQWQKFFDIETPLLRERCLFSCVGNHELVDGAGVEYVRYFGPAEAPNVFPKSALGGPPLGTPMPMDAAASSPALEELSGTYRWSNARFFLVNGMVDYTTGPTRAWLEKALTDSDREPDLVWRIVVAHHGPWSSGPHGDNPQLQGANIPDLLRAHRVDLVISGHDHLYERGNADGLPYLVSGGGGAPVYRIRQPEPTSRRHESVRHFIDASVSASAIQFAAIRPDGSTIERCALRKGSGWDCDGARSVLPTPGGVAPRTSAPRAPEAASKSTCGCQAVGADRLQSGAAQLFSLAVVVLAVLGRLGRRQRDV